MPFSVCKHYVHVDTGFGDRLAVPFVVFAIFIIEPRSPPQNITVSVINSTALQLVWIPPPSEDRNGVITGYTVNVTLGSSSQAAQTVVPADSVSLTVSNLRSYRLYTVTIAVTNTVGSGPFSSPFTALTDEDGRYNRMPCMHQFTTTMSFKWKQCK